MLLYKLTCYSVSSPPSNKPVQWLWLMFARKLSPLAAPPVPLSVPSPCSAAAPHEEPQTNILHLSTRHFWFSCQNTKLRIFALPTHRRKQAQHTHTYTYGHTWSATCTRQSFIIIWACYMRHQFVCPRHIFTSFISSSNIAGKRLENCLR